MIKYVAISLIYLFALGTIWVEKRSGHVSSRSAWTGFAMLISAWAWMLYSVSTLRPASPIVVLEGLLHGIPGLRKWLIE